MLRDGRLIVAVEDPARRDCIDEVEFITQLKVVPALARLGSLTFAIPGAYERFGNQPVSAIGGALPALAMDFRLDSSDKLIETLEREGQEQSARETAREEEKDRQIEQSDNSLVRLINKIIIDAHNQGVSDIHIETYPGKEKTNIRFRKDGVLQPYLELPPTYRSALVSADQDHVRPRHLRAPQAAGRQDQLRQVLRPPQDRAAGRHHPDHQRPRRRGDAHPGVGQADPAGEAGLCRAQPARA